MINFSELMRTVWFSLDVECVRFYLVLISVSRVSLGNITFTFMHLAHCRTFKVLCTVMCVRCILINLQFFTQCSVESAWFWDLNLMVNFMGVHKHRSSLICKTMITTNRNNALFYAILLCKCVSVFTLKIQNQNPALIFARAFKWQATKSEPELNLM